jgi:putative membrane protein
LPAVGKFFHLLFKDYPMAIVAQFFAALFLILHIYIVWLETVLFKTRARKVFGISKEHAEILAPAMSNQGCYNGFLAAALACGFLLPDPATAHAFTVYGLACIAVAGVWGAVTVTVRILFVQTVPAVLGLVSLFLS